MKYCVIYFLLPGPTFFSFEPEISAFSGHSSKYALGGQLSLNPALRLRALFRRPGQSTKSPGYRRSVSHHDIIVYCRLVVHTDAIRDTRAQKMISHTVAQFAHNQHGEKQNTLSSPQLYCHSQKHKKLLVIQCITCGHE